MDDDIWGSNNNNNNDTAIAIPQPLIMKDLKAEKALENQSLELIESLKVSIIMSAASFDLSNYTPHLNNDKLCKFWKDMVRILELSEIIIVLGHSFTCSSIETRHHSKRRND